MYRLRPRPHSGDHHLVAAGHQGEHPRRLLGLGNPGLHLGHLGLELLRGLVGRLLCAEGGAERAHRGRHGTRAVEVVGIEHQRRYPGGGKDLGRILLTLVSAGEQHQIGLQGEDLLRIGGGAGRQHGLDLGGLGELVTGTVGDRTGGHRCDPLVADQVQGEVAGLGGQCHHPLRRPYDLHLLLAHSHRARPLLGRSATGCGLAGWFGSGAGLVGAG